MKLPKPTLLLECGHWTERQEIPDNQVQPAGAGTPTDVWCDQDDHPRGWSKVVGAGTVWEDDE